MERDSRILLVEGETDRGFFEQVCKLVLNPMPTIKVSVPKDYQGQIRNSKQGVFITLRQLLLGLMSEDSQPKRLAAIVDADYDITNGLGFQKTLEQVKTIAAEHDFDLSATHSNGFIFRNGELAFGLWIMPNNKRDGMLEDFIKTCIKSDEQVLFNHASQTIQAISEPKFDKTIHLTKAEIATWLAWQKTPGHGFYAAVKDDLLQTDHDLFQELQRWLKQIFI